MIKKRFNLPITSLDVEPTEWMSINHFIYIYEFQWDQKNEEEDDENL